MSIDLLSLPDIELIGYLLKSDDGGQKMKGVIRPISRQSNCPSCGKKFQYLPKLGYACHSCKTVPNRFRIDLHYSGHRFYVCSDKRGQPLAYIAASSGVSIAIIKEVLWYTDIRTTQKYSHVDVLSQSQVFAAQKRECGKMAKVRALTE